MKERFIHMPEVGVQDAVYINGAGEESLQAKKPSTLIVSFGKPGGAGGLVSGVKPLAGAEGATWIFAGDNNGNSEHGGPEEVLRTDEGGSIRMVGVPLDKEVRDSAYFGIANGVLWPILHGLEQKVEEQSTQPRDFDRFKEVQKHFADKIAQNLGKDTFTFINDYQISGVALELRKQGYNDAKLAFFLHTPFPKKESFMHLHHSMREYFLQGLLAHDFVGFQTTVSKENFIATAKEVLNIPDDAIETEGNMTYITWNGRRVGIEDVPIGIDTKAFEAQGRKLAVLEKTREVKEKYKDEFIYFFLGRRDYTKGIPQLLEVADVLLEEHPELIGKVRFVIAAQETRGGLEQYKKHTIIIDTLVKVLNEKYPNTVDYKPEGLGGDEVFANYGVADCLLAPSSEDGFVLTVPEAISVWKGQGKTDGVIVVGKTIGAVQVYGDNLLQVVPHKAGPGRDETAREKREDFANALYRAYAMPKEEKEEIFKKLYAINKGHDVYGWGAEIKKRTMARALAA